MKFNAFNPEKHYDRLGNYVCTGSVGVMQIACVHRIHDIESLKDVEINIAAARVIYDDDRSKGGNGWSKWGAYTDGRYKKYIAYR